MSLPRYGDMVAINGVVYEWTRTGWVAQPKLEDKLRSTRMSKDPVSYARPNRGAQDLAEQKEELPPELRAELRENRSLDLESNLAKLFADGKQRTINDALVDYWHAHKTVIKRGTMIQTLAAMAKGGRAVRRAGKGVYVSLKVGQPARVQPIPCDERVSATANPTWDEEHTNARQ